MHRRKPEETTCSCTSKDKRVSEATWLCPCGGRLRDQIWKVNWSHIGAKAIILQTSNLPNSQLYSQVKSCFSKIISHRGPLCPFKTCWKMVGKISALRSWPEVSLLFGKCPVLVIKVCLNTEHNLSHSFLQKCWKSISLNRVFRSRLDVHSIDLWQATLQSPEWLSVSGIPQMVKLLAHNTQLPCLAQAKLLCLFCCW